MKNRILIVTAVIFIALFSAGGYLYKQSVNEKLAQESYSVFVKAHSPSLGKKSAKVHIVEFFDPECGTCQKFHPITKKLLKKYDGKVKLSVRYIGFHKNSSFVLRVIESARRQGKFWETLEAMYEKAHYWSDYHNPKPEKLWEILPNVKGLDVEKLRSDMLLEDVQKIIGVDFADSKTLNIKRTPTFFVNSKPLEKFGALELEQLIQSEIKRLYQ